MSILFSPLGESDPIRDCYDGPMLHILRYYQDIDTCYLVTTKKLEENNSFEKCSFAIKDLAEQQNRKITSYHIKTGIEKANDFDCFYNIFLEEIIKIVNDHPNEKIYLNLSSGTPQMITTLALISCISLIGNFEAIQVSRASENAKDSFNRTTDNRYDVVAAIENNIDNLENVNRCSKLELMTIYHNNNKEKVTAFLKNFDYDAAYQTYNKQSNNSSFCRKEILELIQHLKYRQELDIDRAKEVVKNNPYKDKLFLTYITQDKRENKILEYFLILKNLKEAEKINDFLIRLNSYTGEVQKEFINKKIKYDVQEKLCQKDNKSHLYYLKSEKIKNYSQDLFDKLDKRFEGFQDAAINIEALNVIINFELNKINYDKKDLIIKTFDQVEKLKANRNKSAHELKIVKATDLKDENGNKIDLNNLMSNFQKILKEIYPDVSEKYFMLYSDLNNFILEQLHMQKNKN